MALATYIITPSMVPSVICLDVASGVSLPLLPFWLPTEPLLHQVKAAVWSPDGSTLVYVPETDKQASPDLEFWSQLVTMPVGGGSHRVLDSRSSDDKVIGTDIAWSNDGKLLAYSLYPWDGPELSPTMRVVDAVTGQVKVTVANATGASWSQ